MHIFIIAVLCNYPWELAQAPLYVGMEDSRTALWHCFVASLGDGLMVLGIVASGGVTVEWVAVRVLQRWAYTARMPRVPGLDVGLVPVAQMLILPPLILRLVALWRGRTAASA